MHVALVAFDGFEELETFLVLGLLGRLASAGWKAEIAGPSTRLTSAGGVTVEAQRPLAYANEADAVVFCGNLFARAIAGDSGQPSSLLDRLQLDPLRQHVAGIGSGTLMLARFGLLGDMPAAADAATRPWLVEAGVRAEEAAFHARGPIATASGGLAAAHVAAWLMVRGAGWAAAAQALHGAAPAGAQAEGVERLLGPLRPFVADAPP